VVVKQRFHLLIQNNKATNKYYRYPLFLLLIIITAIITAIIIAIITAIIIIIITALIIGGRRNRRGRGLLNRRCGRRNWRGRGLLNNTRVITAVITTLIIGGRRCGRLNWRGWGLLNNACIITAVIIALIIGGRHRFGVLVRSFCCGNRRRNGNRLLNRWR
jgi:hypothetical protein